MAKYTVLRDHVILGVPYKAGDTFDDPNLKPRFHAPLVRRGILQEIVDDAPKTVASAEETKEAAKAQERADREALKEARKAPKAEKPAEPPADPAEDA